MKIDIITLFPGMFGGFLKESMIKLAQEKDLVQIKTHDLRKWTSDKRKTADDKPFGGGAGMIMKVEPVFKALEDIVKEKDREKTKIILMTPQGRTLDQMVCRQLSELERIVLVCGHYEGVDERIRLLVDDEISIGDYIITGGELAACIIVDSVTRLLPGVLGNPEGLDTETFDNGLIEYPQYTRPREYKEMKVPDVLLSGDHKKIENWRKRQALKKTKEKRPDLYKSHES
jgi:tRNA (guanine37-N1)-methyltransferase